MNMHQPGGIRKKITFWFYLLLSFMLAISVMTYWVVVEVEKKHFIIEKADLFLEDVLEVRRSEKDFLLYGDEKSMAQWAGYLDKSLGQMTENRETFVRLSSAREINAVQHALDSYMDTFEQFRNAQGDAEQNAGNIRKQGNRLTVLVEELIVHEHQTIHRLLAVTRKMLLVGLPMLVVVVGAVAAWLGKGIVSSLKQLESYAATIAGGKFVELAASSDNQEVNSLIQALNRMSRELKMRQQQLVRAEKLVSLGTMLAGVAHEFNNPLSNISSSAQILVEELDGRENAFARELLAQIGSETRRASTIVRTLLSLAREDKFHRDHYLLKPLCEEIVTLLYGQIGKGIDVQLTIADDVQIFADRQKIQQLFINLLQNSIDALRDRGNITIKAWQNQVGVRIVVSDDGPGIPRQMQQKIFDPFFTTKETGQGSGLGLFIAHDIVLQHGGQITISSGVGEGSTFTIVLPGRESLDEGS